MKAPMRLSDLRRSFARGCSEPNCNHKHDGEPLIIAQACHPGDSIITTFDPVRGVLSFICAARVRSEGGTCDNLVCAVQVAE